MKILIADDDTTSRMLLNATLVRLGHEVVATTDGEAAWAAWQQCYFPVLISDWMMPGWDGLRLCRAVRAQERPAYTLVMMLTALGGKLNYLEAMNAGADDFLTKPLDAEQLAARLHVAERVLGLRRQLRQMEGLLPICAYCKRIRDDTRGWTPIESYVARRSEARFSHGICPECAQRCFPTGEASLASGAAPLTPG